MKKSQIYFAIGNGFCWSCFFISNPVLSAIGLMFVCIGMLFSIFEIRAFREKMLMEQLDFMEEEILRMSRQHSEQLHSLSVLVGQNGHANTVDNDDLVHQKPINDEVREEPTNNDKTDEPSDRKIDLS